MADHSETIQVVCSILMILGGCVSIGAAIVAGYHTRKAKKALDESTRYLETLEKK